MKLDWKDPALRRVIAIVLAVVAAFGVTIAVTDDDGDGRPERIEITVNAQQGDGLPAKELTVPEAAVDEARAELDHADLDAAPEAAQPPTDVQLERAADVQADVKALPEAGAVQGFAGCATRILPTNFSSRNGARATWQVMHYTVSPNRPGWSDVNAIIALFSNPGRQASSNFVIDAEGNCAYIVPIEAKAWTQAGGNPWSVSYEVIATGSEAAYLGDAGWAKLTSVVHQVAKRTGIPLSRGATSSSCTPVRSGIVQHKDFGLCGGGHVDITPFSIDDVVRRVGQVAPATPLTRREQRIARGACKPKGTGHSRTFWRGLARTQVRRLDSLHKRGRPWKARKSGLRRQQLAKAAAGRCG